MIIKCVSAAVPTAAEGSNVPKTPGRWPVKVGATYRVLALSESKGVWFAFFEYDGGEMPVSAPLVLFEVVDPTVSRSWNVRITPTRVAFQPVEFDEEYFCDDVQERRGDSLERYRALKARLESESTGG